MLRWLGGDGEEGPGLLRLLMKCIVEGFGIFMFWIVKNGKNEKKRQ